MGEPPLVYSVVVNYEAYEDTKECLESLATLDYQRDRHRTIVVNNHVRDERLKALSRDFPEVKTITTGENLGFSGGYNDGIRHALEAGADYVLVLNNDVVLRSDFLEQIVEAAERRENVGIVGGKTYFHDDQERIWAAGGDISWLKASGVGRGWNEVDTGGYDEAVPVDYVPGSQMLIHRNLLEDVGLFPEEYFLGGEELEFAVRARRAGYEVFYTPSAVLWHKVGHTGGSNFSTFYNEYRNKILFMRRNLPTPFGILWLLAFSIYGFTLSPIHFRLKTAHDPWMMYSAIISAIRDHIQDGTGVTRTEYEWALERDEDFS